MALGRKEVRRVLRARVLQSMHVKLMEINSELEVAHNSEDADWSPAERLNLRAWRYLVDCCERQIKRKLDAEVFG